MRIELVEGDVTAQSVDAIVNAANSSLLAGGGVDGAIHRKGGPAILDDCRALRASQYPDGVLPLVSMQIVNKGAVSCTLDVGTDVQLYEIVSGNDPIWNSRDCQREPAGAQMVVEPNVPLTTTPFTWDRTRSSTSTCDSERPAVSADGATYRLSVTLGAIRSETDAPFMLF